MAYSCIVSAKVVYVSGAPMRRSDWWIVGGLLLWAFAWFIFPAGLFLAESFYFNSMILQAVGILVTGSAMLTYFLETVTEDLQAQYQVSQIMSGVVQHDIRNYLQTIRGSIELAEAESEHRSHWIEMSAATVNRASDFIDEMREIAANLSRVRPKPAEVDLRAAIDHVKARVVSEYSLEDRQIEVGVSKDTTVLSCGMVRELLWNILDNAFKHGSSNVVIRTAEKNGMTVSLEIEDDGKGLPEEVMAFMNTPDALKRPVAPGLGLGIVLIRGLALLCGVHLETSHCRSSSGVTGTCYHLTFDRPPTTGSI